jgi:sugar phosphate isomerase/epimerase
MAPEQRRTVVDVRRFAATLAGVAAPLADHGLRVGYHNHDFEFGQLEGSTIWDVLVAELPPAVELELDVYWLSVGGRDPVTEIRAARDRVRLLHMKDRAPGPQPRDAPAGTGILPFAAIVEAGRLAGVEWYIAEQDEPADAIADITTAARNLEALAG